MKSESTNAGPTGKLTPVTLELSDEVVGQIEAQAALEGKSLEGIIMEALEAKAAQLRQTIPPPMTYQQAREWTLRHRDAAATGTDLDVDLLDAAFVAVFGRTPEESEDAFGALKRHFNP